MINIAIIGAGMTGITLANMLQTKVKLTLFEKSRGIGGRMSTRRAEPYQFNHGAQYFKINNKEFKDFLSPLIKKKIIKPWKPNYIEFINKKFIKKHKFNNKYYTGVTKMNSIVKYLAKNSFFIKSSCKIEEIKREQNKWIIIDSEKLYYGPYDWLFLTIPPNQTTDILDKNFKYLQIIKKIKMRSCYSIMLGFEKIKEFNFDTALLLDEDIRWLSINKRNIGKKVFTNLLINSSYNFAEKNINRSNDLLSEFLIKQASGILNYDLKHYNHKAVHFWKYAMTEKSNNFGSFLDENLKIVVSGDWCMNGKVEGAFLSAKDAVRKFLTYIN